MALDAGELEHIAGVLARSRSALFVTGAGISAESGLPTYRGVGGLYDRGPTEGGVPVEVALSGRMLRKDPELCWRYIADIERACRGARPNRAHRVIASLEERLERVWVLTQNVDGLHRMAGSRKVIEIHGRVHELICTRCTWRDQVTDYSALQVPPTCPQCGALVRPDVVLFGEMLPTSAVQELYRQLDLGFDVVFSVGTSSVFPYIAEPVLRARWRKRTSVEINPGSTAVSDQVTHRIRAKAGAALDAIWEAYRATAG